MGASKDPTVQRRSYEETINMPMDVFNHLGHRINLADELGRGGEGSVFNVQSDPMLVAKVYHKQVDPEKSEKLRVMRDMAVPELITVAAWPIGTSS